MSRPQAAPRSETRPTVARRLRDLLSRLGGGIPQDSIGTEKRDRTTTVVLGLVGALNTVLVLTVLTWALTVVLGTRWYVALLPAAVLGLVVLGVNSILVDSVVTPRSMRAKVSVVLIGLSAAAVLGALPASAMSLLVFTTALDSVRTAAVEQEYAEITELERKEHDLVMAIGAPDRPPVDANPEVQRLKDELEAKDGDLKAAEDAKLCERTGRCGTRVGRGEGYRELQDTVRRLKDERKALADELDRTRAAAKTDIDAVVAQQRARDETELGTLRTRLDQQRSQHDAALDAIRSDDRDRDSQLARLGALAGLLMTWGPVVFGFAGVVAGYLVLHMATVVLKLLCGTSPAEAAAYGESFLERSHDAGGSDAADHEVVETAEHQHRAVVLPMQQHDTSSRPAGTPS